MSSQTNLHTLVNTFNEHSKSELLLLKKCSDLKEEKHYVVHGMEKVATTVGDAILVKLSDAPFKQGDVPKFQVFLPKRFVTLLQNEDLDLITPGIMYLVSHGICGNNSTELTLHMYNSL